MLQQKLQNRQPNALEGLGVVLGIAVAAVAGSMFFTRLQPRLGTLASLGFIAYGCAIAWFLLYWYVQGFIYTANDDCLRVCRTYGKRERFMADVWLNQVTAYGPLEEVKARCPGAHVANATRSQCPFEPLALAYRTGGKDEIIVIQPDDPMRKHLLGKIKR